jgi:hypothetical protein
VDGTGPSSWSREQVELLRALRRDLPDPLIELAQFARALTAGPTFKKQLNAWAAKWHLKELREVARLHVYYWAGTPAAANALTLLTPSALPLVVLRPRPPTVIAHADGDVEWSEPVQLDPKNPLHPVCVLPNESDADALARFRAHLKAWKRITPRVRRPRTPAQHADWYVLKVVARRTYAAIAADRKLFGAKRGNIDTIKKGIREFRKRLRGK